jgi:hypothetical protein
MKKERICPMTPYPIYQQQMIPQMMPQMVPPGIMMNDIQGNENQIDKIDKQIRNLENRISKLENTVYSNFNTTNYSNGNYHIV